jgi:hypothetical protein
LTLHDIPLEIVSADSSLPLVTQAHDHIQLYGYDDASYANGLQEHCSTTVYSFLLAGVVVTYCSKTQSITTTSYTEAEFLAAISSGKVAKYLRSILSQLSFSQQGPTPICKENESTKW